MAKRNRDDVSEPARLELELERKAAYERRRVAIRGATLTTEQRVERLLGCTDVMLRVYAGQHPKPNRKP